MRIPVPEPSGLRFARQCVRRPWPYRPTCRLRLFSIKPRTARSTPGPSPTRKGLLGMVRSSELEQAADDGASNQRVGEILREASWSAHQTLTGDPPHVYPDHSLSRGARTHGEHRAECSAGGQPRERAAVDRDGRPGRCPRRVRRGETGRTDGEKALMAEPSTGRSFLGTVALVLPGDRGRSLRSICFWPGWSGRRPGSRRHACSRRGVT